jgi:hypothetical protein
MGSALEAVPLDEETRKSLRQFFLHSSAYVVGQELGEPGDSELGARWREQCVLDDIISAIAAGQDDEVLARVPPFASRPSVFVGLLVRMMQTGHARLLGFVMYEVEREPSLATRRFAGRTILHFACGAGCLDVVRLVLKMGADPNIEDRGGHTPLYCVANECAGESGAEIVRTLVRAGAKVNACGGVTKATALHMAARRGFGEIARALVDCGAALEARDRKGDTPLQRALNCRRYEVWQFLADQRG